MVMYCGGFENYNIFLKKQNRPAKTTASEYYQKKTLTKRWVRVSLLNSRSDGTFMKFGQMMKQVPCEVQIAFTNQPTNKQPTNQPNKQTNQDKPKQSKARDVSQPQNSSQIPKKSVAAPPPVPRNSNVVALLAPSMATDAGWEGKLVLTFS